MFYNKLRMKPTSIVSTWVQRVLMALAACFLSAQSWALTNSYSTAVALTSNVEDAFDTGATIGLGILAFLIALAFVLKGIRVGHRG